MNFDHVMRTENVMKSTFIRLFVNVYALYCVLKIGAFNFPIKGITFLSLVSTESVKWLG